MKRHTQGLVCGFVLAMSCLAATAADADGNTTTIAKQESAVVATAGDLILPSGIYGTRGDAMEQVEEITAKIEAMLKARNLKVGDLMRHTIYLKAGAQEPAKIFTRLIGNLRRMGPELTNNPTGGTIVVVPSFPDPSTQLMVEFIGGRAPNGMTRVPIMFGPRMSVESVGNEQFVASFGLEGLDFYGVGGLPANNLNEEMESLVRITGAMLGHAGLSFANIVSYSLYVTKGTDPVVATAKFHELMRARSPDINSSPSAGTVIVIDGATVPSIRVQVNLIASRAKPAAVSRVPQGEVPTDTAAQSVSVGGAVFVSGVGGVDYEKNGVVPEEIADQADAAARSINAALKQAGGLKLSNVARFDIYVKHGEDPAAASAAFYKAVRKLDPSFDQKKVAAVLAMVQGFPRASTKFLVSAVAASK